MKSLPVPLPRDEGVAFGARGGVGARGTAGVGASGNLKLKRGTSTNLEEPVSAAASPGASPWVAAAAGGTSPTPSTGRSPAASSVPVPSPASAESRLPCPMAREAPSWPSPDPAPVPPTFGPKTAASTTESASRKEATSPTIAKVRSRASQTASCSPAPCMSVDCRWGALVTGRSPFIVTGQGYAGDLHGPSLRGLVSGYLARGERPMPFGPPRVIVRPSREAGHRAHRQSQGTT